MQWPTLDEMTALTPLPDGFRFELLTRADIAPLIDAVRESFPSVSVGAGSAYLSEEFYLEKAVIDGNMNRDVIVILIKIGDEIAGMGSWEREVAAMTLYARLGFIAPAHRGTGLAVVAMQHGERMGRAMGAGFIYTLATMKVPFMQMALERAGYQILGFMPGYDREEVADGVVKRVYEAGYGKRLAPAEEFLRPDVRNMTPTAKRLFDILFPSA